MRISENTVVKGFFELVNNYYKNNIFMTMIKQLIDVYILYIYKQEREIKMRELLVRFINRNRKFNPMNLI